MLKNKVFVAQIVVHIGIVVIAVIGYASIPSVAWAIFAGVASTFVSCMYTAKRYKDIEAVTLYLTQLQTGVKRLDIRDNREGELSILKNEIYKLTQKLTNQAELMKRDKLYLADSLSDISHQLKTPLTSMMVMADLLSEDELPVEKQREFLRNIQSGLERMQWLVQSLLKLSKLDADAVMLKKEKVEVESLINKAIEPLLIPMEIKNQTLTIHGVSDISFNGDALWTTEAIGNIVKNCLEHTPEGGELTISYGQNNLYTNIVIADNGEGIDAEDLPHIFERFYKGKNASSDSVGIGLALSKSIIFRQKGTVDVTSKPGGGTTFIIKFYV